MAKNKSQSSQVALGLNNCSAVRRKFTLMAADCVPSSLMERDWTDTTDNVDPSIFPALSFVILHHLDITVTHLSVSMELRLRFHMMNWGLCHRGEKLTFLSTEHSSWWGPKFLSNLFSLASWTEYMFFIVTSLVWFIDIGILIYLTCQRVYGIEQ